MNKTLAITLACLISSSAAAQTVYMDRDRERKTEVSGASGEIHKHAIPEADRALALTGFKFYTLEGQTHGIYAKAQPLPGREGTQQTHGEWALGEWYQVDGSKMKTHEIHRGAGYYVRGVRVCTQSDPNTGQRSIRGLKVRYARVKADGSLNIQDDPEVWVNPTGCDTWDELVKCAPGELAIGYRAHKSDMGFRALSLICSAVAVRGN